MLTKRTALAGLILALGAAFLACLVMTVGIEIAQRSKRLEQP